MNPNSDPQQFTTKESPNGKSDHTLNLFFNCSADQRALTAQPDTQQHQESRVVSRPLILRLLSVMKVPIDPLRGSEQVEHLPASKLEVHLPETEKPSQVFVALRPRRVSRCIPGIQGSVPLQRGAR